MAEPADRLSELKIDRSADAAAGRRWLVPALVILVVAALAAGWVWFAGSGGGA